MAPNDYNEVVEPVESKTEKLTLPVEEWEKKVADANIPEEIKDALRKEIVALQEEAEAINAGKAAPLRLFSTNTVPIGVTFLLPKSGTRYIRIKEKSQKRGVYGSLRRVDENGNRISRNRRVVSNTERSLRGQKARAARLSRSSN